MTNRLNGFFKWLNRQSTVIVIFLLCMANYFGFALSGGEEQYFAFARQFMDPSWMPHSFTLNHPAGGNLAFQVVAGFLLQFISFENLAAWGRTVNFLMYAIPLALIFRKLRISNIEIIFLMQVIFFSHQSLYAGEWIFNSVEEKSVAYIFVFWALYSLLNNKPVQSSVFAAIATWFHFLVGGWMFCFVFLYFMVRKERFGVLLKSGASYVLLTLPLVIYLYRTYMTGNPAIVDGINTNAVYAFWRLKHHIGIFSDFMYFFHFSSMGVLITLILFWLCVFRFSRIDDVRIKQLNTLNIIIFSQQVIFMLVAIFDRNGVLMKTYPFRTSSLSVLLSLIEITLILKLYLPGYIHKKALTGLSGKPLRLKKIFITTALNLLLIMVALPVLTVESVRTVKDLGSMRGDLDADMLELIDYVKTNTPDSSVFIFPDRDKPLSFIRRAERERFVVYKFTPTRSETIAEWYKRSLLKERLKKDISLIDSIRMVYRIDYMVTDSAYSHPALSQEKQFGSHRLYKIAD